MKVTIIIPNYNGKHFMEPCLKSLAEQTCSDFHILVVDNASSDGSVEYMRKNYPNIELISLNQNYGFSTAVNVGIKHATTPYVLLLNNDTTVDSKFVEEMVAAIEKSPHIFSVSSKMIQMYHPELIDSAGDMYTVLGWGYCRGGGLSISNHNADGTVFSSCAGAAIYRREVFSKIGYFDENHFAYLEDIDVGYRAKIYGYKNTYCHSAVVYHVGSGTSGSKYNSFKVRLSARNNIYLNYKNMPSIQFIINFIPLLLGFLIKYIFFIKKGFGKEYREGILEGIKTRKNCKKVPFQWKHLPAYFKIELELISNTFSYFSQFLSKKRNPGI